MKLLLKVAVVTVGSMALLVAKPNVSREGFTKELASMAGKPGEFIRHKEDFPKDYFLVHQNLPFLAGLSLHHPQSSILELSKNQIDAIKKVKKRTVPAVVKKAKKIKQLELQLAQNVAKKTSDPKSQFKLIDTIAKLRAELTKDHLVCINDVRDILSNEQYQKLLTYATKLVKNKNMEFKIDDLIILPSPGRLIKTGKLTVTKEQNERINKEVKSVYPPIFQDKIREAFKIEKKIQKLVAKGKTKEELANLLDQVAKLKREAVDGKIDALNHTKKIVTEDQWKTINRSIK